MEVSALRSQRNEIGDRIDGEDRHDAGNINRQDRSRSKAADTTLESEEAAENLLCLLDGEGRLVMLVMMELVLLVILLHQNP